MPEYSFTMEFAEEVARRFAAGDTISEIAGDTYNPSEDIEELLRVQIRAMTGALSQAQMMASMTTNGGSVHYGEEEAEHDYPAQLAGMRCGAEEHRRKHPGYCGDRERHERADRIRKGRCH